VKLKQAPAQFKAGGSDAGTFEAIVSVFNNVDAYGDVVLPGAFTKTIADWAASPDTLPVLWSHRMDDPTYNIGAVIEIGELAAGDGRIPEWADEHVKANGGLWVKGLIDTGPDASPIAVQALRLLKARRVTQFSYAYEEVDSSWITHNGQDAWGLATLKLYEVSPTQIGANELTELLAAKRRKETDGQSDRPAKPSEEPEGAKRGEEPSAATVRLLADLALAEISN
jgi:uncharacterized protein